jgi:hypothetical protein
MNFLERINAVFHGKKPDKTPVVIYERLIPRGDFEREMRNRGMGLYAKHPLYWQETPNVTTEIERQKDTHLTIYHTPEGSISTGRKAGKIKWMIENPDDYKPLIFMIEDTIIHVDYSVYSNVARDLGSDGIVNGIGIEPPIREAAGYMENPERERRERPGEFSKLLEALEKRMEKIMPIVSESPAKLISVGEINNSVTPEQFSEYFVPFYQKYLPFLHDKGRICALEVRTPKLKPFMNLISQTNIDVIEGFTPMPDGDLSIDEALGDYKTVWLNFPESVLLGNIEKVREYTAKMLNMTGSSLIIGLTDIKPVTDEATENAFKTGLRTIMDVVDTNSA